MKPLHLLGWLALLPCAPARAESNPPVTPEALVASLQEAVAKGNPGLSAAIATRRGVVWTGVAGSADVQRGTPLDEACVFGVGSITKMFVAVVALQLVEEGKLRLSDTAAGILGSKAVAGIANADKATLEQLLAHRSGVPSWEDDPKWIREGRGSALIPSRLWGRMDALAYIRGKDHPAVNEPGAGFSYSNSNFTLIGLMIEKVTGRTAAAEIRRRILTPLGLASTWIEGFEPGRPALLPHRYHYATSVFRKDAGVAPQFPEVRPGLIDVTASNLSVEWTAGGLVSTPRDLVTFAIALRDGRLLKPTSLAFMKAWGPARRTSQMGHSLFRFSRTEEPLLGHNGSVLGFTGSLFWSEEGDAVVAVLSNVGSMHAGDIPPAAYDVAQYSRFTSLALLYASQHSGSGQ